MRPKAAEKKRSEFDPETFLSTIDGGRKIAAFSKKQTVFVQGDSADAYLLKTCAASEIVSAVGQALRGKKYLSKSMSSDVIDILRWQDKELKNEAQRLTDRQRDVLQLLAEGRTMKEIGTILQMSSRTVAHHKYRMMEVLGVKSNAELVKYAVRNKIVAA